jgi:ribosomal protein S18 acetylase RimI-like enzyme
MSPEPSLDDDDRAALDNPVWSALTTLQASFGRSAGLARRYLPEVAPFGAVREHAPRAWADLRALLLPGEQVAFLGAAPLATPAGLHAEALGTVAQMLAPALEPGQPPDGLIELGDADAPEMLRLATLTKPGPFGPRTHELGSFLGVRADGRLVAMAGERMRFGRWVEISGVCVHPEHRGAGHAARLMTAVGARIVAHGARPFLHVFAHNTGAIALYERLGFTTRARFELNRLGLADPAD